jgi:lanosterol synthase
LGPITAALRSELYGDVPPELAVRHRHDLAPSDAYVYPGRLLRWIYDLTRYLGTAVRYVPGRRLLRRRALDSCIARITFEQRATNFQGLSPVSGILNTLALLSRDSQSRDVAASFAGIESWRWDDAANGSRYAGARSTTWDTSFAIQALLAGGPVRSLQLGESLRRAYRRLTEMQVTDEVAGRGHARDPIQGGWCFSDGAHRWPVSDCTAEAAIAILDCDAVPGLIPVTERLAEARLRQAGGFMLDRQNPDGGFGTYERRRGRRFLEGLNPSQMFGQCMTELSYLECTASSIRALVRLTRRNLLSDPDVGRDAIARGVAFILTQQQRDGSWPGFWGINYIYGTYFALAALRDADLPADHGAFVRADSWLRSVQHADGGWGEHFSGCLSGSFVDHPSSLIISTAWACLALMQIDAGIPEPLRRGIEYLESRRDADSGWPREGVNGVFFGTAMLEYELYNAYFPAMAVSCFEVRSHGVD